MSGEINIQIILGSTREGRHGEKVGKWIYSLASKREDFKAELIDLTDWTIPYSDTIAPAMGYSSEIVKRWSEKIKSADGYIIVTPEYNHGYPAVLKNALDHLYEEWNNKPVAFVSYGGPSAGIRVVEQLRQVVVELQMAPIREEVNIPLVWQAFDEHGDLKGEGYDQKAEGMFNQLVWWATALKKSR